MPDRLADGFVLYRLHDGPSGERRLIKFSYDEPLTLRYSKSSYQPHDGEGKGEGRIRRHRSSKVALARLVASGRLFPDTN